MPLGLLSLAASIVDKDYLAHVYKPQYRLINPNDYKKVAKHILDQKPSVIGFSTWCISYAASLLLAEQLKTQAPKIPIVFGGPQASILAKETLSNFSFVDYVLAGEADKTFPEFLDRFQNSNLHQIKGLSFRKNGDKIVQNKQFSLPDVETLPDPAYHLIPRTKTLKLDVGRGCPFNCTYCSTNSFFSKNYRVKSSERILREMQKAKQELKIESFSFAHDMFTLNKNFVFDLCKQLSSSSINGSDFSWTCSARIDCVSTDMLTQMKKSGCQSIFFGIESGSEKMQKSIKKNLKVNESYKIAEHCRKIGLNMHASFILGFPDEKRADIEDTLKIILKLATKGTFVQVSDLSLLPGTPLFQSNSKKLKFDGRFSSFSHTICSNHELELIQKYPQIFSSFYYLPVYALSRSEMTFCCAIINKLSQFRNTLFLAGSTIISEMEKTNLLAYLKKLNAEYLESKQEGSPLIAFFISILKKFLRENSNRINHPFLFEVFSYEAYVALLKTLYLRWNIVHGNDYQKSRLSKNFLIKPTPVWKIYESSFLIEKVLPSENNWGEKDISCKKGKYHYLLLATSEKNVKRIRLKNKEVFLFEQLSEVTFKKFSDQVQGVLSEKETLLWLKKMRRLGVIKIENLK